jgi:hypothetical protein
MTGKHVAIGFLTSIAAGTVTEAFDKYVGADFLHHNPHFAGDAASLRDAMQTVSSPSPMPTDSALELLPGDERAIEEGPLFPAWQSDPRGVFVGSSFILESGRDWARRDTALVRTALGRLRDAG